MRASLRGFVLATALAAASSLSLVAQQSQTRDGFWFSLGRGYGSLGCFGCGGGRVGGLSGGLSLGWTVNPRLLLGVGTTGWIDAAGYTSAGTLDARVRFYPKATGRFFVTGGAGLGTISGERGLGLLGGVGYDLRLGGAGSLTPYVNLMLIEAGGRSTNVGQAGLAVTLQ